MAKSSSPPEESAAEGEATAESASDTLISEGGTAPMGPYHILAVYSFVEPKLLEEDLAVLKQHIDTYCRQHNVRGSLLLAPEGINGTISYPPPSPPPHPQPSSTTSDQDSVQSFLKELFPTIRTRLSFSPNGHVFYRLKIKLKKEILTLRSDDNLITDPTQQKGIYVRPGEEWNALLKDPECWVIDARNDYEVRLGTFRNAEDPHTTNFSQLLPWMKQGLAVRKPNKIAMFCTGGIRCEKASAACIDMVAAAADNNNNNNNNNNIPVYHLEGGILAYLDSVAEEDSLWDGSCYVFDQRVAVGHGLKAVEDVAMCYACRGPLTLAQQEGHPDFIQGRQCLYCKDTVTQQQQERFDARQRQIQLAAKKGIVHIHDPKEQQQQQSWPKKQKSVI